jgi:hypothetical protein
MLHPELVLLSHLPPGSVYLMLQAPRG